MDGRRERLASEAASLTKRELGQRIPGLLEAGTFNFPSSLPFPSLLSLAVAAGSLTRRRVGFRSDSLFSPSSITAPQQNRHRSKKLLR